MGMMGAGLVPVVVVFGSSGGRVWFTGEGQPRPYYTRDDFLAEGAKCTNNSKLAWHLA